MSNVLVIGEPIVAVMPDEPTRAGASSRCRFSVGGAELNTAVALHRLGVHVHFVGAVGDDLLGRIVLEHLEQEGMTTDGISIDAVRPTACYVREWLPDGQRRISYHRRDSAGTTLTFHDKDWVHPDLVHLSGITVALGPTPASAVGTVAARAARDAVPISFDPNHRPALWSADTARQRLVEIAARSQIVLLSEDDRDAMYPGESDVDVIRSLQRRTCGIVAMKLGARGAIATDGRSLVEQAATQVAHAVDPVGAGDAFNAGFLAAHLAGADLDDALRVGAHVAACVVEVPGDHDGAPRALPPELERVIGTSTDRGAPQGRRPT